MAPRSAHIQVNFADDYDVVKLRAANLNSRGIPLLRPRVEQRGFTRLNPNTTWAMAQDDPDYALDADGGLYDEALAQDGLQEEEEIVVQKKKKYKRSVASVSGNHKSSRLILMYDLGKTKCLLAK